MNERQHAQLIEVLDRLADALERLVHQLDAVTGTDDHRRRFIRTWEWDNNEG